jgi:hypothetical protein
VAEIGLPFDMNNLFVGELDLRWFVAVLVYLG